MPYVVDMRDVIEHLCDGDEQTSRKAAGIKNLMASEISVNEMFRWYIGALRNDMQEADTVHDTIGAAL